VHARDASTERSLGKGEVRSREEEVESLARRNGVLRRLALPSPAPLTKFNPSVGVPEG